MKKIVAFIAVVGILSLGNLTAQEVPSTENESSEMPDIETDDEYVIEEDPSTETTLTPDEGGNAETGTTGNNTDDKNTDSCGDEDEPSPYQDLKIKFIEGGPIFMAFVLIMSINLFQREIDYRVPLSIHILFGIVAPYGWFKFYEYLKKIFVHT